LSCKKVKTLVFADLDGSLLDDTYDYGEVQPIISELSALGVAIVFCSSKTRAEILFYQKKMQIKEPFIVENGSAIFVPKGYFSSGFAYTKRVGAHDVIELGIPYWMIRQKLARVRSETHATIVGFGDLTANQISADSGLPLRLAKLAKKREYDEPFCVLEGNEGKVLCAIENQGFYCVEGGKYLHILSDTDKGKAVSTLTGLFARELGEVSTVGIGDSPNDLSMLEQVDAAFFVKKSGGKNAIVDTWRKILGVVCDSTKIKRMPAPMAAIMCNPKNSPRENKLCRKKHLLLTNLFQEARTKSVFATLSKNYQIKYLASQKESFQSRPRRPWCGLG
jgi:mannosyl-3-phosphoglycerate phosphatase